MCFTSCTKIYIYLPVFELFVVEITDDYLEEYVLINGCFNYNGVEHLKLRSQMSTHGRVFKHLIRTETLMHKNLLDNTTDIKLHATMFIEFMRKLRKFY